MTKKRKSRLKSLKEARRQTYVPVDELPDLELNDPGRGFYTIPGPQRCNALGLVLGDCRQRREPGRLYCYYHEKLSVELLEPTAPVYPVWPLPAERWTLPVLDESSVPTQDWVRSS